jgi:succinate dehydrogenase / fumarate reductase, membrane anchor subunit
MSRRSHGLRAWIWQRVSALYMAAFLLVFGLYLMISPPGSWLEWRDLVANAAVNLATGLFFAALLLHAWVGGRDVIIDYVHSLALRLTMLGLMGLVLAGSGLWVLGVLYALY